MGETTSPSRSSYFFFDVDESRYRNEVIPYYEISTTEEFGDGERAGSRSNCEIPLVLADDDTGNSSEPSETLICLVDLLEGDIQVKDIHFTFNFPGGMCTYIRTSLPWHINRRIYPGPVVAEEECGDDEEDCGFRNTNCSGGTLCPSPMKPRAGEEEGLCPGTNNIKCCLGGLQADGETEWKPDIECFGGPALIATGDIAQSKEDFYVSTVTELHEEGLVQDFTLPNIISINKGHRSSLPHINYHKDLDKSLENLNNLNRNSLPVFLRLPGTELSSSNNQLTRDFLSYYGRPRLFFDFECFEAGDELPHKIAVMIREWNTLEQFLDFFDDGGNDSSNPDVTGVEGDDCEYEDRTLLANEGGNRCNDSLDMDDYTTYPHVPYSTTEE